MRVCRCYRKINNNFALVVYFYMVFVAVKGFAALLRPARVRIFLFKFVGVFGLLPFFGYLAFFDLFIFLTAVALAWRFNKRRVD
jgi:hypothetical protein